LKICLLGLTKVVSNTQNVDAWVKTITDRATSPVAMGQASQLSNLINYYNKAPVKAPAQDINWQQWDSVIQSKGVVSTIKEGYEALIVEEYNVDAVATSITTAPSEEYTAIVWIRFNIYKTLIL
jgi:hypothetical protein